MVKEEQFLTLVQSAFLAAALDASRQWAGSQALIVLERMSEALAAAARIPENMSAKDAAVEFCGWKMDQSDKPYWCREHAVTSQRRMNA